MRLLEVKNLTKYFPVKKGVLGKVIGYVKAVDNISFYIDENEVFGLVGESGSGKTTTARCILLLYKPTRGDIIFEGRSILKLSGKQLKWYRTRVQAVFQNPFLSLNPMMKVKDIIAEPLRAHREDLDKNEVYKIVYDIMDKVTLPKELAERYPYDLSGGQAQRVAIARAIVLRPKLLILDEPTSALDVSVQAQILNLLDDLRKEFKMSYLIISHDLSVVRYISNRVAVMYLGKIVEMAETEELFEKPLHPYTQALLSAVPEPDPELLRRKKRVKLPGEIPSALNPPKGCRLHPRCPYELTSKCTEEEPPLIEVEKGHFVACWKYAKA